MIKKYASAHWDGDIKTGKGTISTQSEALKDQPYGFNTRFEDKAGTNPEELIAAAHASCFTMALSLQLAEHGLEPHILDTKCTISLDKNDSGFSISKSYLEFTAKLDGADEATFKKALQAAKQGCPISKLLNCDIELNVTFTDGKASQAA